MDAALLFKLYSNRAKVGRLLKLMTLAIEAIKPDIPEIIAVGSELAAELYPDFGRQSAATKPLASFDVKWLQTSLNALGQKIPVDADYGKATRDAVTAFQATHGLIPDGWAGVETCSAIIVALTKVTKPKSVS